MDRLRVTFYPGSPSLSLFLPSTYSVTYFDDFLASRTFLGVCVLLMGRDGYHIFQGSRGGNDTRLHCLGTVEISGIVLVLFLLHLVELVRFSFILFFHILFGLYIGLWGWVTCEYSLLPCHGCSGWLGVWLRSETMGCGVVFCLKSISWGSSRGTCDRPYCVENGLLLLPMSYIDSTLGTIH
jgi:hypothetical protein